MLRNAVIIDRDDFVYVKSRIVKALNECQEIPDCEAKDRLRKLLIDAMKTVEIE